MYNFLKASQSDRFAFESGSSRTEVADSLLEHFKQHHTGRCHFLSFLFSPLLLDPLFSSLPISFPLLHSLHLSPQIFTSGLQSSVFSSPHLLWPPLFFFSPSPLLSTRLVSSSSSFIIISVIKRHIHFYCESRKSSLPPAGSAGLLW